VRKIIALLFTVGVLFNPVLLKADEASGEVWLSLTKKDKNKFALGSLRVVSFEKGLEYTEDKVSVVVECMDKILSGDNASEYRKNKMSYHLVICASFALQ